MHEYMYNRLYTVYCIYNQTTRMNHTPAYPLHAVIGFPNFSRLTGKALNGNIRQSSIGDADVLYIQPPQQDKRSLGVSFLEPRAPLTDALDSFLCGMTPVNCPLPEGLNFIEEGDISVPVGEDATVISCGKLWTLYHSGSEELPVSMFTDRYREFMANCLPREQEGVKNVDVATVLDINMDHLPFNRVTAAACMAMDSLAEHSPDPSTRLLRTVFAGHLRSVDPELTRDNLSPAILEQAAVALEQWTVRDPLLFSNALFAQKLLQEQLSVQTTKRVHYVPYWVPYE